MMEKTLSEFVDGLKERLRKNNGAYLEHHSRCGSTEGGFYDEDVFDFDALVCEIDKFSAEFKEKTCR